MRKVIPQFVPYWGRDEIDAVSGILENSDYLNEHKTVRSFESSFAEYVGAKYCVAVPSGTTALYCAINALNLQGEEIRSHSRARRHIRVQRAFGRRGLAGGVRCRFPRAT